MKRRPNDFTCASSQRPVAMDDDDFSAYYWLLEGLDRESDDDGQ